MLNALISLIRGDNVDAGLSLLSMIPFAGWGAAAGKVGKYALEGADVLGTVAKFGDEAVDTVEAVAKHADEVANTGETILKNAEDVGDVIEGIGKGTNNIVQDTGKAGGELVEDAGKGLPKVGDTFGQLGKLVDNPNIKPDWSITSAHGTERMAQRGVTQDMVYKWMSEGKVLEQTSGNYIYISKEGAVVFSKSGKMITTYSSQYFDENMWNIVKQLFGE